MQGINKIVSDDDLGVDGDDFDLVVSDNSRQTTFTPKNVGFGSIDRSGLINTNNDLSSGNILMPRSADNNIGLNSVLNNPLFV